MRENKTETIPVYMREQNNIDYLDDSGYFMTFLDNFDNLVGKKVIYRRARRYSRLKKKVWSFPVT